MISRPKVIQDYYVLIYSPAHSRAMNGYVPEQVLVAENSLGRKLTPDEEVRHINGNSQDNRPSNLEIITTNSDFRTQYVEYIGSEKVKRSPKGTFTPCKFQKPCWKYIRGPKAKKEGIYLPLICSFQTEGDIYNCGHFWNFIDDELKKSEGEKDS